MKKATLTGITFTLLAGLSIAFIGCNVKNETGEKASAPTPVSGVVYKDTVHLSTAQADIKNYVDICDHYMNDKVPIRSYSINKSDLFGVLGVTAVPDSRFEHCRVYIGIDGENKFRLFMTPTVKSIAKGSTDTLFVDSIPYDAVHNTYFVYDLNAPCPSTCDKGSKLYIPNKK